MVLPYLLSSSFTSDFWFYYYYYICIHPALPLVFYSTGLMLLSYYTMRISCLISLTSLCLLLYACAHDRFSIHALLIRIYWYACAYPITPLGIYHTTRWRVSDSPGSLCPDLGAWNLWILSVADQKCAAVAWIIGRSSEALSFQPPCSALKIFFCDSCAPFVLFIVIYLFIFSHLRLSVI